MATPQELADAARAGDPHPVRLEVDACTHGGARRCYDCFLAEWRAADAYYKAVYAWRRERGLIDRHSEFTEAGWLYFRAAS